MGRMTRNQYHATIGLRVPTRAVKAKTDGGWHICPDCGNKTRSGQTNDPRCLKCQHKH